MHSSQSNPTNPNLELLPPAQEWCKRTIKCVWTAASGRSGHAHALASLTPRALQACFTALLQHSWASTATCASLTPRLHPEFLLQLRSSPHIPKCGWGRSLESSTSDCGGGVAFCSPSPYNTMDPAWNTPANQGEPPLTLSSEPLIYYMQ